MFFFGFAELPGAEQLVGVGLDLLAAERGHGRHDELNAGLLLEVGELALEVGGGDRREDVRLIDDPPGERRESWPPRAPRRPQRPR